MTITDACVCPYPAGDSSIRRMALEARELGFDRLVAVGVPSGEYSGLPVIEGVLISGGSAKDIAARVKRASTAGALVVVQAGENRFNRAVLGMKGVHVLTGIHAADRHAFDHVTAKMAADRRIALDISLAPLIRQRGAARQKALNRYLDILMLSRKFGFPLTLSTHARSVLEMRSVREVSALASLIGFDVADVEKALGSVDTLLAPQSSVKVIS
ncbi:MAG: Ribonuclease P protein component 3 [Methanoregula sp. PtaU1.Bin051]|nr:MAG: Ribonuclease P protein component 3 [Methanoregula sp. PtaU1.Bin051]